MASQFDKAADAQVREPTMAVELIQVHDGFADFPPALMQIERATSLINQVMPVSGIDAPATSCALVLLRSWIHSQWNA